MTDPVAEPTPTDEYDRLCAERRERLCDTLNLMTAAWVLLHGFGVIVLCGGATGSGPGLATIWFVMTLFCLLWLGSVAAASWSAWLALWNRDVLPVGRVVQGVLPWAVLLVEMTLLVPALLFGI